MGQLQRLQEQVNEISVTATSDDDTVRVHACGTGEISVQLRAGALRGQSEKSLERTINRVIDDAMWELRVAYREISARTLGTSY